MCIYIHDALLLAFVIKLLNLQLRAIWGGGVGRENFRVITLNNREGMCFI
jgi:hypothetical protein